MPFFSWLLSFFVPAVASAHEVYVLPADAIARDMALPALWPATLLQDHAGQFVFWAFISILVVFCVFFISISHFLEGRLDPWLMKIKKYAPLVSRITLGVSFIAAAFSGAVFGPELPLSVFFGSFAPVAALLLGLAGVFIILNSYTVYAAGVGVVFFLLAAFHSGFYMLTYLNYLGEMIFLIWVGLQRKKAPALPYTLLRVFFGVALIYTSVYAKLLHGALALDTVGRYNLTQFLPFDPHFLVLGAAIIEIVIGLFFILGIEIRFTSLFLLFWLIQSLMFFGEVVWPHIILFGIPLSFILYGYDCYSLEGYFFKRGNCEPVL